MAVNARTISDDELFFGHKACAGCGGALVVRQVLKVLGPHAVSALPAGCMSAVGFNFPQLCFSNNSFITPFAATASVISGIEAGLRAQGKKLDDCTVVGFAGDGGTADIGIQALSGAIDRNDDVLYVCYDNEAYMNTGIQKSSLTPFGASTTTTPVGSQEQGCPTQKKNMFEIVAAHDIPYAATASIGYLPDLLRKVEKAKGIHGTRYLHVIAPCPTGWGHATDVTIDIAKEAVDCGLWYLAEFEGTQVSGRPGGEFTLNRDPKEFSDVVHYLRGQKRFRHMTDEQIQVVVDGRDRTWERLRAQWE
jgi:pyruvate ferredoxin oxidoreductase beta subunit